MDSFRESPEILTFDPLLSCYNDGEVEDDDRGITIRLDRPLHKRLRIAAVKADLPMSEVIRRLIREWVEKEEKENP